MNNIPTSPNDPVNTDILLVAEDRIKGFRRLPFHAISEQCGHPVPVVIQRLKAMMEAGVVRRVRQTLLATKLAQGALVAWSLPEEKLDAAFDWMKELDPFTGHVVLRNTDAANPGANYRLWTTVKVPVGCGTPEEHCGILKRHIGADGYVLLPARGVFALGWGTCAAGASGPEKNSGTGPHAGNENRISLRTGMEGAPLRQGTAQA